MSLAMSPAKVRGMGKEADMAINEFTHLHSSRPSMGTALLLVTLLLVVLVAAVALAARTPWVLDQPLPPYNWAIVP
jgi:hypothetical protein